MKQFNWLSLLFLIASNPNLHPAEAHAQAKHLPVCELSSSVKLGAPITFLIKDGNICTIQFDLSRKKAAQKLSNKKLAIDFRTADGTPVNALDASKAQRLNQSLRLTLVPAASDKNIGLVYTSDRNEPYVLFEDGRFYKAKKTRKKNKIAAYKLITRLDPSVAPYLGGVSRLPILVNADKSPETLVFESQVDSNGMQTDAYVFFVDIPGGNSLEINFVSSSTALPTATNTNTPAPTSTPTLTPNPTSPPATPTSAPNATSTAIPTATFTATSLPTNSPTAQATATSTDTPSPLECSDKKDNDNDGYIDFADPGCKRVGDNCEAVLECDDGRDNDHDGRTDFPSDFDCREYCDDSEAP